MATASPELIGRYQGLKSIGEGPTGKPLREGFNTVEFCQRFGALTAASVTPEEGSRWSSTAAEQFNLALAAPSNFQLSSWMVSPKIVTMFNQARR